MEATTPELGPVLFWSPKSSSFSGSDSIVVEEDAKNVLSPGCQDLTHRIPRRPDSYAIAAEAKP